MNVHIFFHNYIKLIVVSIVYLLHDKRPITRQTYDYATPITYEINPRNIFELDPNSDDHDFYILRPEPMKKATTYAYTISN